MYVSRSTLLYETNVHVFNQGRTNNFTHPAIADLRKSFYYGMDKGLGHLFPEVFGKEVPTPAVVLVATAVRA